MVTYQRKCICGQRTSLFEKGWFAIWYIAYINTSWNTTETLVLRITCGTNVFDILLLFQMMMYKYIKLYKHERFAGTLCLHIAEGCSNSVSYYIMKSLVAQRLAVLW